MQLSLRWLWDHIDGSYEPYHSKSDALITQINVTTAEVDGFTVITYDWNKFVIAQVTAMTEQECMLTIPELGHDIRLPRRFDEHEQDYFLLTRDGESYQWTSIRELHADKDEHLPALCVDAACVRDGSWRDSLEPDDIIITIDNTAITHRPDLWSQRGFAREVAAILGLPLKPLEELSVTHAIAPEPQTGPYSIVISDRALCDRFVGLYVSHVDGAKCTSLWMASRLARLQTRPANILVDTTNYVLQDIGQPMHAFDATRLPGNDVTVRGAHSGERLALLDGNTIDLQDTDCVISSDNEAVSLAGIMGGRESRVHADTTTLFLEAAHFDPALIRATSQRTKNRTESSIRFEKNCDPNGAEQAIRRYLYLLHTCGIAYTADAPIASIGEPFKPGSSIISHEMIESRLGMAIASHRVIDILQSIGFIVKMHDDVYDIVVPTHRAIRDVRIPEDIIEEIARFVGYDAIPHIVPHRAVYPTNSDPALRRRLIRHHAAYVLAMREVCTYAFFDERFLKRLECEPADAPRLINPVSENWQRLVTTLIPGLCKCVYENRHTQDEVRFFEIGKRWFQANPETVEEHPVVSGIWFHRHESYDFYVLKSHLQGLFKALNVDVEWKAALQTNTHNPFFDSIRTASLWLKRNGNEVFLGYVGYLAEKWKAFLEGSDALVFELSIDALMHAETVDYAFREMPRYQSTYFDVSVCALYDRTVKEIERIIAAVDERISEVYLIDMFEKDEWPDKRALTFRVVAYDWYKTMLSQEINDLIASVYARIQEENIEIR